MIEKFSLERVNKSPASFDPKKLQAFEDWHFQQLSLEQKIALATPFLEKAGLVASPTDGRASGRSPRRSSPPPATGSKWPATSWRSPISSSADDQLTYDEPAFDKHLRKADGAALLAKFRDRLAAAEPFDAPTLEALMQQFVAAEADQDRPDHPRRARGRHRQVGRPGAVRYAGDSRPRAVFAADRERDRIDDAEEGYTCALSSEYNG